MKKAIIKVGIIWIFILIIWNIFNVNDTLTFFLIGSMIIDYCLGTYTAFLQKSTNSINGKLSSKVGYAGIMKKVGILVMVWIGYEIDVNFSLNICKNMIIVGYLINEIISIEENLSTIGVEKNVAIKKVIAILENFIDGDDEDV